MYPFLVLLQTHSGMSAAKISSACGPLWRCSVSARRAMILSHTVLLLSWVLAWPPRGPGAATAHGPGLTLVLLLSEGAVRCYCHNMPLSSQYTATTYSGYHHLYWACSRIWTAKESWPKAVWGSVASCKHPVSLPVFFPLWAIRKGLFGSQALQSFDWNSCDEIKLTCRCSQLFSFRFIST